MDSSTYVPNQSDIVEFTNPNANSNDQPVNYGQQLFQVMNAVSDRVGGAEYLIGVHIFALSNVSELLMTYDTGLSLRTPNSTNIPLLAGDAQHYLGDKLDAFLLGNVRNAYRVQTSRVSSFPLDRSPISTRDTVRDLILRTTL